jgi:hypothetical protein
MLKALSPCCDTRVDEGSALVLYLALKRAAIVAGLTLALLLCLALALLVNLASGKDLGNFCVADSRQDRRPGIRLLDLLVRWLIVVLGGYWLSGLVATSNLLRN